MPMLSGSVAARLASATAGGVILAPGYQANLWPLPIDWRAEWRESYEFNTEVITSRDQHEQRRALRKNPRVSYEFLSSDLGNDAGRQMRQRLAKREHLSWVVPHGRLFARTTAAIPQGGTAFSLDADPSWMAAGREIVFRRADDAELAEAATYAGGSGTLTAGTIAEIPAGTPVHLGVRGRMEAKSQFRLATTTLGEITLRFQAEPGGHYVPAAGAANATHNGKEVWTARPNWARALSIDFDAFQDVIDQGFGVLGYVNPTDYVERTFQAEFHVRDAADIATIYGLFIRSHGKRSDFYMPAWNKELLPSAISTTEMTFTGTEISSLLGADPSHRHVALFRKDGTALYRKVDVFAASGPDSVLAFAEPIPALTLDDLHYVTWLLPTRFFSDRLQLDWVTNIAAVATVSFLTLRDET